MEIDFKRESGFWDEFLIENNGSFLQSFEWGNFQEKLGKKVWRMEVKDGQKVLLEAQVIKEKIFFKNYFYVPYGPVFGSDNSREENLSAFELLLKNIRELAEKEEVFFLRIEPVSLLPETSRFNFKKTDRRVQPGKTLILDIDKPEGELLMSFKKRARYNIRLAEKKGVGIKILDKYSGVFYKLLGKTKERQEFRSYPEEHYKQIMETEGKDFKARIFLAEFQGKPVVATLAIFFGNKVTTLHTGFDYCQRALKAPYLVRWKVISEGKKLGKRECDFWGIDEKKWPGVTSLKKSFGGREVEYGKGLELVFNPVWFFLYNILRKIL